MTEIFLIRHTQAEGNLYHMMQGHWDGDVTELGLREIDALAGRFRDIPLDAVYSSDLYRARITATALTRYNPRPVIPRRALREINMGPWETQFFANLSYSCPEKTRCFITAPGQWQVDGAETYMDVQKRAMAELRTLAEAHPGQRIGAVSHGVTIRCIMCAVLGVSLDAQELPPIFKNTAVTRLSYENGVFTAHEMNDTSHLDHMQLPPWRPGLEVRHEAMDPRVDAEYYSLCYSEAWKAAHGSLKAFSPLPYLKGAQEHFEADPNSILRFYDATGEAVGLLDMDPKRGAEDGAGWISLLYVREDRRRKTCGVQMLARALMYFRALGRRSIRLHVAEDNSAALSFYKKHGFAIIGAEPNGLGTLLLMEKSLEEKRHAL